MVFVFIELGAGYRSVMKRKSGDGELREKGAREVRGDLYFFHSAVSSSGPHPRKRL